MHLLLRITLTCSLMQEGGLIFRCAISCRFDPGDVLRVTARVKAHRLNWGGWTSPIKVYTASLPATAEGGRDAAGCLKGGRGDSVGGKFHDDHCGICFSGAGVRLRCLGEIA